MKEDILDVLMYMLDHYAFKNANSAKEQDVLITQLQEVGFAASNVEKAFDWLKGLTADKQPSNIALLAKTSSLRIFSPKETNILNDECQGFILFLEQLNVLSPEDRELTIERVMALEYKDIDLQQLKWVIFIVLSNRPGKEAALAWMEAVVMGETCVTFH